MPLHNHLLLNGYTATPPQSEKFVVDWLTALVDEIGMKIAAGPFATYVEKDGNKGVTGAVIIETSHIALHVWDEPSPAFLEFDLYTCSTLPVTTVLRNLEKNIGLIKYDYMVIERSSGFNIVTRDSVDLT